ncbi:MAG: diaminopimelate epimerase [Candidatus Eisenbacteria bacterium]|uniref:Diaminopimelate epimerase n=1 Tax=Eiseniibacteriota bacterium TaxID=2212470 RepID=A0A948W659_UNCEI|nr:diaminopimelate epimerase [Candidatus Eisenbacteria bacterium]MBU1947593.1 diaminopimelate epimerase [Candidatus Eisenbacteria bacterium]MBU2690296.1 diaminopimelate epimerase [Candidatus Eisenbacteria bacterium]
MKPEDHPASSFEFVKVEGAGNDFILVDGRLQPMTWDSKKIRKLCDRRRGIGADGLLYIEPRVKGGLQVRFRNPDGEVAAFCGNGARCIAAYLLLDGKLPPFIFRLEDYAVEAEPAGPGRFRTSMPDPEGRHLGPVTFPAADGEGLEFPSKGILRAALVTVGVPHLVLLCTADLFDRPVSQWGPPLSRHAVVGPSRANVNLILKEGPPEKLPKSRPDQPMERKTWRLRTFERGVEDETLACGSGITAAAWALTSWKEAGTPITIQPTGRDELTVFGETDIRTAAYKTEDRGRWFLEGPARIIYRGRINEGG